MVEHFPGLETTAGCSSLESDNQNNTGCTRCHDGHSEAKNNGNSSLLPTLNLCPCCYQALTAFSSWISKDKWKASLPAPAQSLPGDKHLVPPETKASFLHSHHLDFRDIPSAIDNYGCRLCSLLMGPYFQGSAKGNQDQPDFGPLFLKFQAEIEGQNEELRLSLDFTVRLGSKRHNCSSSMLQLVALSQPVHYDASNLKRVTLQTSSDYTQALRQSKDWLEECLHSHPNCKISTSVKPSNPTRLISVKSSRVHLCRGGSLSLGTLYVTLSHCWGNLEILTLTTSNFEALHSSIEMDDLCKSFQDAIQITRQLGYSYLWIDSLCIIQDSETDWLKESTSMTQVYGNSTLNIAATGASDGSIGCFFQRAPPMQQKFEIRVLLGGQLQILRFFDALMAYHGIEKQSLTKRAWTVQERILPRRILHFSEWEVFWECNTKSVCESFPDESPSPVRHGHYQKHTPSIWETVVMMYSGGQLTKSRDKLVAIAGVAQTYGLGEDYLAGMWRGGLELMLRWVKLSDGGQHAPRQHKAPSWSWASMDREVHFLGDLQILQSNHRLCVSTKSARVELSNENPFGEVRGGVLQLDCQLMILLPKELTNPDGLFYDFRPHRPIPKSQLWTWGSLSWDHHDDYEEANLSDSIYFVPIFENTLASQDITSSMEGLMLRSTGNKRGEYRRIGWFNIPHFRPNVEPRAPWDWLEAAISKFQDSADRLEPQDYISIYINDNGERRCLIEII